MSIQAKLAELGLTLPEAALPVAAYVPAVRTGNLVFTAGQLPLVDGKIPFIGKVGSDVTPEQAKEMAQVSYGGKVTTLSAQIAAIQSEKNLKLQQAKNKIRQGYLKVKSDSIDLIAVRTQVKIANTQFNRAIALNKEGLKPMTDVEQKNIKLQGAQAKLISQENKLLASRNDIINAENIWGRELGSIKGKTTRQKTKQVNACWEP